MKVRTTRTVRRTRVNASSTSSKKLYKEVEDVADRLEIILDKFGKTKGIEDYLSEYELRDLGDAYDILMDTASYLHHADK